MKNKITEGKMRGANIKNITTSSSEIISSPQKKSSSISDDIINEYNNIIAEYIELYKKSTIRGYRYKFNDKLYFNESLDWLLPVIEKIESTHDEFHGYFGVHIVSNSCTIQGTNLRTDPENPCYTYFNQIHGDNKVQATWLAVVSFIKWYTNYKDNL